MSRLVIVSNRVTVPEPGKTPPAGGLAVAVDAALKNRSGIWFGWSGKIDDSPNTKPTVAERDNLTYVVTDLSSADYQEYYNGFANRVLWPILHYRVDLAEFSRSDLTGYLRVNGLFADKLSPFLQPDDMIWVHDYHLMPLARELRARGHQNPLGFFLHIPCPPPDLLFTIPRQEQSLGVMSHYDLIGFQTDNDRENYARYLRMSGAHLGRDGSSFQFDGRVTRIGTFPVSIETAQYAAIAEQSESSDFVREVKDSLAGRQLLIGVDRLDYSKGIIHRVEAFNHFLETEPAWRNRVVMLQVTPKSREEIPEYSDMSARREYAGERGQRPLRRGRLDADPLHQPVLWPLRSCRHLPRSGRSARHAAARRHESCRQGICGRTGPGRSRRLDPIAVRRRRRRAGLCADRQSS